MLVNIKLISPTNLCIRKINSAIIAYNKNVSCILDKIFTMKKLLLICTILFFGLQTFSFSPGNAGRKINIPYTAQGKLNAMALQEFLNLTPKRYFELTGKKMTFKQKIGFAILKAKLKRQLADEKSAPHKTDLGLLSLIFGAGAWVFAFIPGIGIASIGFAVAAVVLGILGLNRKKGDTKSVIGLVLGSLFLLLLVVAVAAFASGGWY